jgi:predicted nicotinamide N-methyase
MLTRDFEVNGGKVSVLQKLELGHAGTVWDGALVLLAYLNKHRLMSQEMLQGKVVLELGSGTGIVGLACNLFQAKTVILTDFPENLQLLRDNT